MLRGQERRWSENEDGPGGYNTLPDVSLLRLREAVKRTILLGEEKTLYYGSSKIQGDKECIFASDSTVHTAGLGKHHASICLPIS